MMRQLILCSKSFSFNFLIDLRLGKFGIFMENKQKLSNKLNVDECPAKRSAVHLLIVFHMKTCYATAAVFFCLWKVFLYSFSLAAIIIFIIRNRFL